MFVGQCFSYGFASNAWQSAVCIQNHEQLPETCPNLATSPICTLAAAVLNLKVGLQQNSLGVEKIFLHGWIRDEIAVPQGPNGFCSVPIFHDEKSGFVLKRWRLAPAGEAGKARCFSKTDMKQSFPQETGGALVHCRAKTC